MTTKTNCIEAIFRDARELQADALEILDQGKIRNAAEKAWGATKRATDALVLARGERNPQPAGQARRALMRLSPGDQVMVALQREYHFKARMLHSDCFYEGNCEPEQEMTDLKRATISYIQTAEGLYSVA